MKPIEIIEVDTRSSTLNTYIEDIEQSSIKKSDIIDELYDDIASLEFDNEYLKKEIKDTTNQLEIAVLVSSVIIVCLVYLLIF